MIEINQGSAGRTRVVANSTNSTSAPHHISNADINKAINILQKQKTSDASLTNTDSGIDGSSVHSDNTNMSGSTSNTKMTTTSNNHAIPASSSSNSSTVQDANATILSSSSHGNSAHVSNGKSLLHDNHLVRQINHVGEDVMSDGIGSSVILEEIGSKDENHSVNATNE